MFFLALGFIASLPGRGLAVPVKAKGKVSGFFVPEKRLRWYEWAGLGVAFLVCFNNFVIGPLRTDYLAVDTVKPRYEKTAAGQIIKQEVKPFGSQERLISYQDTLAASPMGKYQISEFFGQGFLQALQDKTREISADQQIKEFDYLTDLLNKNIRENPLDYKARIVLGGLYTFWGLIDNSKYALAESTLQDAIKIAPSDQEGYWNLAQTKLFEMQIDNALSLAHQALDLEPDHPKSQTMVFQIESIKKRLGDKLPAANPKP
jgi:tetratricopeptide (TPR) repeat protein